MQLQNVDRNELQLILTQLNQALHNHQQWYDDITRTISCRLPGDNRNIMPDAHKNCRFGQWYYSITTSKIVDHPGFIAIGEAHQHMHLLAAQLLTNLEHSNQVTPLDYDTFSNSLERLRLEIYALKSELETILFTRDPLTTTINRVTMLPMLREQQDLTKRQLQSCCIAMIDLDLFKKINDDYGHLVGDKVLISVANYISDHLRAYDKIFRYGGEEFLLCLPQTTLPQALAMVDRLRAGIAELKLDTDLDKPLHITVSCGISALSPNHTIEHTIDQADKALYLAKTSGRNQTKIWSTDMTQHSQ